MLDAVHEVLVVEVSEGFVLGWENDSKAEGELENCLDGQ